jgi:hypothetical protein
MSGSGLTWFKESPDKDKVILKLTATQILQNIHAMS